MESEVLVTVSLRFPAAQRAALATRLGPMIAEALATEALSTTVSVQPYDPDETVD